MRKTSCKSAPPTELTISVDPSTHVSALLQQPPEPHACLVLAHGAGAGMRHPFMTAVADTLATLGMATLRYQFPYAERGCSRPDPPALCHAIVRAAVVLARATLSGLPLIAGGKSFGGPNDLSKRKPLSR